jgi:hypothetical protein
MLEHSGGRMKLASCALVLACLLCLPSARAQPAAGVSGHWQGSIAAPGQDLAIEVDLAQNPKGEWIGSIDIPPQGLKGSPLSDIAVKGNSVTFGMKGAPGEPTFNGKLSVDGKTIFGGFTQGGNDLTFSLKRTGEAVIETPPKSTTIGKEIEGLWEGALDVKGTILRLKVKLSNQPDGTATGTMISVDQGGGEIPITTITETGSNLKLEVKTIQGSYDGDLTDGVLVGHWMQRGATFPLTFKRPQEGKK